MAHMKIFNTLTRKKEEFIPQVEGEYKIYVCGPTVYNFVHIGNARPAVIFDTMRRYLEYRGNKVNYVSMENYNMVILYSLVHLQLMLSIFQYLYLYN